MTLLANGRWATAVETHAFAPIFFGVLVLMVAALVLPRPYSKKLSTTVAVLEGKTGITAIITLGMIFYWLLRNFIF
jgi:NhaP-type Na+/H+ or K+/H+ antiporter